MVPAWAVVPTAGKLIAQSFRRPRTEKVIVIDEDEHRVRLVSPDDAPVAASTQLDG